MLRSRLNWIRLYFAKIGIGTPPNNYYVQVDTGSDIMCGASQSGDLISSDETFDGILGFGKSNSSMLSQLASSGKVKNMFAHCLDGVNGGGIFAIGNVVQPKVNMTPLVPDHEMLGRKYCCRAFPETVKAGPVFSDLILSNKLVVYDLENQAIGWTEYNCSSSIEFTGSVRLVGANSLSSGSSLTPQMALTFLTVRLTVKRILQSVDTAVCGCQAGCANSTFRMDCKGKAEI
ncbi:hypothetical protein RND71_026145 [Anisodus tanguticus]|uniref:Xylanase inhibitor N-terminal domain-containing protein n=1 Tax=Anisodus tanguticus TaxID=243964 RepID=A0AAE1V827_9SOLA|nr:hypothetical protein RND71_026145 [Anisodus tanguticus]